MRDSQIQFEIRTSIWGSAKVSNLCFNPTVFLLFYSLQNKHRQGSYDIIKNGLKEFIHQMLTI
jgi:hypothetical protein